MSNLVKRLKWQGLPTILIIFGLFSCHQNDNLTPGNQISSETLAVNNFIWDNMDHYYLWRDYMPQNIDLTQEPDPKALFDKLLYKTEDRWSFITDNKNDLINELNGIQKSFGFNFKLYKQSSSSDIFGVIEYVVDGSPAATAGLKRGDVFMKVDDNQLTVDNYTTLLFNRDNYTLTLGDMSGNGPVANSTKISLNAQIVVENPVFLHKIIDTGQTKIGYLVYNQFIPQYDTLLQNIFQTFIDSGISDLVLDLRYNPGGSITSADNLASMIAPSSVVNQNDVFTRFEWNSIMEDYFKQQEGENSPNLVINYEPNGVNLNLSRLYILVSQNTASASELIINGLKPYLNVMLIGEDHTSGKYTGSITITDPNNKLNWALQPIVIRSSNANGVTDYKNGFTPDYTVPDDLFDPLGSTNETMLAKAIELITGQNQAVNARILTYQKRLNAELIMSGGMKPSEENMGMYLNR